MDPKGHIISKQVSTSPQNIELLKSFSRPFLSKNGKLMKINNSDNSLGGL
jgi:hypothetical protein